MISSSRLPVNFSTFGCGRIFRGRDPLVFARGNNARFDRGVDRGDDDRLLDRGLQSPDAGAFLAGFVEDHVDHRFAGVGIFLPENLRSDFDQITVEIAAVPLGENVGQLISR